MTLHRAFQLRRGATSVLSLCIMIVTLVLSACVVDWGYLMAARCELQRSADAAALAAVTELIDRGAPSGSRNVSQCMTNARNMASAYAISNLVCRSGPCVDCNTSNSQNGDVVIGYLSSFNDKSVTMSFSDPLLYNAVKVRIRRAASINGEVPLFFAQVLGIHSAPLQAEATAGIYSDIRGFTTPSDGSKLPFLPFALDLETWNKLQAKATYDTWAWNPGTKTITAGSDGVWEANLYPQGTGSPGNRGTVDIGGSDNSTNVLARQILHGPSKEDLAHHGGRLVLGDDGKLYLNGDTGISAGIKDELLSIKGKPVIIPIFSAVVNPGNNAKYTIVKFVGVRIVDVKLTGSNSTKRVIIQPANVLTGGVIPGSGGGATSDYVYSRPVLVR